MSKLNIDKGVRIPYPVHSNRFQVSYSCDGVKYDFLTLQTVAATYDFRKRELVCKIELDVDGKVEYSLALMCNSRTISDQPVRPTISINRMDGSGDVLYSTMCDIADIISCEVETDYASDGGVAVARLVCKVGSFDVVDGPTKTGE